ncbi:MAG: ABC transporter ATP-binding protein [Clostridia bacterium]|nr:ABC transporter ATP-binding protein [Clostridia bacterium]
MKTKTQTKVREPLPFFGVGRLLPYLAPYRSALLTILSLGAVASLFDTVLPLLQQYALNHFVEKKTLDTLAPFILAYLGVILCAGLVNYISTTVATAVEMRFGRDLRRLAFDRLQTLSLSFYNQNSVGYLHARTMSDTSRIGTLVSWSLLDLVWHSTYLIGAAVIMLILNARLALIVLSVVPVLSLLLAFFQKRLTAAERDIRELKSEITADFNEGITGAKTIKSLAVEDKMCRSFYADTAQMHKKSTRAAAMRGAFSAAMQFASSVAIALVLWHGGVLAAHEVGTFSAFMAYAQGMTEPVRWLVGAISALISTQVNIERLTDLLHTEPDAADTPEVIEKYGDNLAPKTENWEPLRGDIAFCDVTFRYPDGEENVLEHFSLQIPQGSHIAVVGETGAGKSTLASLICRFFEPTSGKILIDGKDARTRSQLWLRKNIGCVLQTPHLFSGSIRDNLRMGKADATEEEIRAALCAARADGVVDRLPDGPDTDVGEGGDLLSTGEKQLICFARALLSDPKILILDEATASVDTLTEQKMQSAMTEICKGRTTLTIAHRLSTVQDADEILVVRDGKIVERGRHTDLMRAGGYYSALYKKQFEYESAAKILKGN